MSTGERIKTARKKAGMTQAELAAKSGLAAILIHQYEAGKRHPQLEQILRIAIALDVEVIELIPEDKQDKFIEYLLEQIAKGKDVSTLKFAPEKARGGGRSRIAERVCWQFMTVC